MESGSARSWSIGLHIASSLLRGMPCALPLRNRADQWNRDVTGGSRESPRLWGLLFGTCHGTDFADLLDGA